MFTRLVCASVCLLGLASPLLSQETKTVAYDVVSIKPSDPGHRGISVHVDDNIYTAINIPLKELLREAYGIRRDLISGGPSWADSTGFDINAKSLEPDRKVMAAVDEKARGLMLQAVLAERFHLRVHTEMKVLPVYELVVMKDGPKFQAASPADKDKRWNNTTAGGMTIHNGQMYAHDVPIERLVDVLANQLHRGIIDKTGLKGGYDMQLTWTRDDDPSPDRTAPFLVQAIEEQMGLKLQSAKGPVETLVIDAAEMPTAD